LTNAMKNGVSENEARMDPGGYEFGTFKGVFTPSILTILGVVMYLRFGWALGHLGLGPTLIIITMSASITFLTGLSLSALATNMKVEGGGAYFIISRSLGIEAGAAVGVPLFFAQALGISFYAAGFAESIVSEYPHAVVRAAEAIGLSEGAAAMVCEYQSQIIGVGTLVVLTVLAGISAEVALRVQFVVMALIGCSLVSYFLGGPPTIPSHAPTAVVAPESFWSVFGVVFPAVTGIEAGIAMSGDLKDPAKSLPRGTIGAVLLGYVVYVLSVIFLWCVVADRDTLVQYPMMIRYVAKWGFVVLAGIWAASLSSAMGALLGAPRTLQALARDKVIPAIFAKGFGKGNDPRVATATAFVVGLAGILMGDLNKIGQVLTMFFLTSYGLLNVSAGLEELTGVPSWRPKFRVPWSVSILGAFSCFAAMFMINAGATFIAAFVAAGIYVLMERRSLSARWGDMRSALLMLIARFSIHALAKRKLDERTWKPIILVLSGSPNGRWHLINLASAISQDRGLMTVAAIVPSDMDKERTESMAASISDYLEKRQVSSLVKVQPAATTLEGAEALVKTYGYGPITPNTIVLGISERPENYLQFSQLVAMVNMRKQNLVLVREADKSALDEDDKRIDVWWYGTQQNLGFMLALAYLLKRSSRWGETELILKTIIDDPDKKQETRDRLDGFIEKVRLKAEARVLVRQSEDIFADIRKHSKGADLVFLGMRAPKEGEGAEDYRKYYEDLLERTQGLPPAALILAAGKTDFYAIFEQP